MVLQTARVYMLKILEIDYWAIFRDTGLFETVASISSFRLFAKDRDSCSVSSSPLLIAASTVLYEERE